MTTETQPETQRTRAPASTRRAPVRAPALPADELAEARATYRRAATDRALDEMFNDYDLTRDP